MAAPTCYHTDDALWAQRYILVGIIQPTISELLVSEGLSRSLPSCDVRRRHADETVRRFRINIWLAELPRKTGKFQVILVWGAPSAGCAATAPETSTRVSIKTALARMDQRVVEGPARIWPTSFQRHMCHARSRRAGEVDVGSVDGAAVAAVPARAHATAQARMLVGSVACSCGRHLTWRCECSAVTYGPRAARDAQIVLRARVRDLKLRTPR
jgi:hypothetical protein